VKYTVRGSGPRPDDEMAGAQVAPTSDEAETGAVVTRTGSQGSNASAARPKEPIVVAEAEGECCKCRACDVTAVVEWSERCVICEVVRDVRLHVSVLASYSLLVLLGDRSTESRRWRVNPSLLGKLTLSWWSST